MMIYDVKQNYFNIVLVIKILHCLVLASVGILNLGKKGYMVRYDMVFK